jgi:hypothetical protein
MPSLRHISEKATNRITCMNCPPENALRGLTHAVCQHSEIRMRMRQACQSTPLGHCSLFLFWGRNSWQPNCLTAVCVLSIVCTNAVEFQAHYLHISIHPTACPPVRLPACPPGRTPIYLCQRVSVYLCSALSYVLFPIVFLFSYYFLTYIFVPSPPFPTALYINLKVHFRSIALSIIERD